MNSVRLLAVMFLCARPAAALVHPATGSAVDAPQEHGVQRVLYVDGGQVRAVERTGAHVGIFIDPATDRRAPVRFDDTAIVGVATGRAPAALLTSLEVLTVRSLMPARGLWLVRSARAEDGLALAARLADAVRSGDLTHAMPNLAFRLAATSIAIPPNDPRYPGQYFFDDIDIEDAWALSTGDPAISVLVADNGCDVTHPDLVDKLDPGIDAVDGDDDPSPGTGAGNSHGTACAGLVAARTDNGVDIAGTCPECRLRCARLLPDDNVFQPLSSDVDTFNFALTADVDVVSNSWGFVDAIPVPGPLRTAIDAVATDGRGGLGAVVVFASGNDSRTVTDDELLAVEGVLGVGAVNNLGELTQYSNIGASVDLVAPTGAVTLDIQGAGGDNPTDVMTTFGGTSSACPIVAGVAGLVLAYAPELSAADVRALLMQTARQTVLATPDSSGHDDAYGFGRVDPAAALRATQESPDAGPAEGEGEGEPPACTSARVTTTPSAVFGFGSVALLLAGVRRRRAVR